MNQQVIDLIIALIRNLSVFMILAYLLTRIPLFGDVLNRTFSAKNRLFLVLVFGLVSIYGTVTGIELFGGYANFRDLGPTIAGLLAGPLVGTAAGLIGGVHRYLLGGITAVPCGLAPIMAGLAGGLFFRLRRGRPVRIWQATLLIVVMEFIHIEMALALSGTSEEMVALTSTALVPMMVSNGGGMAVFAFMLENLARERRTEAAKHRIDSELTIARQIQMSMVPRMNPSGAGDAKTVLHGVIKPAKEVGGDLYNVFPIDSDRLCFAVGDVAGKGVPASLVMAITQKLIKVGMRAARRRPAELLSMLNNEMCDGNDTLTFVTLLLGSVDQRTGEVLLANAGHNPPVLVSAEGAQFIKVNPAIAIGVQENIPYSDQPLQLRPGETLFLYTDGVTEAMDEKERLYSDERLKETLHRLHHLQPEAMCREILADVARFVGGAEQSDDITMVALRFNG
jgi:sigma-B regulation protein RsbU (phosphoserine phosphatase)